jgi:hypothetical protein
MDGTRRWFCGIQLLLCVSPCHKQLVRLLGVAKKSISPYNDKRRRRGIFRNYGLEQSDDRPSRSLKLRHFSGRAPRPGTTKISLSPNPCMGSKSMSQQQDGGSSSPPPWTSFALLHDEKQDSMSSYGASDVGDQQHYQQQNQNQQQPTATSRRMSSSVDDAEVNNNYNAVASSPRTTSFYDPRGSASGLHTSSSFPYAAFPPERTSHSAIGAATRSSSSRTAATTTGSPAPTLLLHEALTAAEFAKLRNWLSRLPQFPPTDDTEAADVAVGAAAAATAATTAPRALAGARRDGGAGGGGGGAAATTLPPPVPPATPNKAFCYDPHYNMMIPASLSMCTMNTAKSNSTSTVNSDYPVFGKSTHAWAIYADTPNKRAGQLDRLVGIFIICFQLFTYYLFAAEAVEDFTEGKVPVTTSHTACLFANHSPTEDLLVCEAGHTHDLDAFVAFFMLGIFLAADFIQAFKVIRIAQGGSQMVFAAFAVIEVVAAYLAATMAVAYQLYVGEVTDAVEVGVGLLFIRELSQRTYSGLQGEGKGAKQYKIFFSVLGTLVVIGMFMDHLCEFMFEYRRDEGEV